MYNYGMYTYGMYTYGMYTNCIYTYYFLLMYRGPQIVRILGHQEIVLLQKSY